MKMKRLWELGYLIRGLQIQMRFGELSRAPLCLLRLQLRENQVECDWMARPADEWDKELPPAIGERNASLQALKDAMAVRELLFCALPAVDSAMFRVYRQPVREPPELIIAGTVNREDQTLLSVCSLVMRAKLCGFRFWLDDGVLEALQLEEQAVSIL